MVKPYAVLKHHIIDVDVALSRATVYTALSVFVVGLFALVDLFFTRALDQKALASSPISRSRLCWVFHSI